jgi:uncharacterized membrane protein
MARGTGLGFVGRIRARFRSYPRLFIAAAVGVLFGLMLPEAPGPLIRAVAAWDVTVTLHVLLVWWMMLRETEARIRRRAALQDESGWTILAVSAGAAFFSLLAIIGLLSGFKSLSAAAQPLHLALALWTIFGSWFFLHTLFTLHYAHEYYGAPLDTAAEQTVRGGLQFQGPGEIHNYLDFAYYSFTIGMTAQTSDTGATTPRMRILTLAHAILTFFFNTVILALSINIAASLL